MKKCNKCKIEKDNSLFSKRKLSKDGLDTWCKECKSAYGMSRNYLPEYPGNKKCSICSLLKSNNEFNIDKRKQDGLDNRCRMCNAKRTSIHSKQRLYGCAPELFLKLLESQGNTCAICKKTNTLNKKNNLSVDHCHSTGKIRGLLCSKCNFGLGQFKDNPELLLKAAEYVKSNQ